MSRTLMFQRTITEVIPLTDSVLLFPRTEVLDELIDFIEHAAPGEVITLKIMEEP